MAQRLDIVLFGASGFTGKWCVRALEKLTKGKSLTWGIAGRSESKLKEALMECQTKIGADLSMVPIIKANIKDYESLKRMTEQAKVVINCCGPYRFFGEPVVKACIETGTHQVDVTGEPQYMEEMQLKYHKVAQEKGVYIISACGFDCVVSDLGVIYLQNNFNGTLNSVEAYMNVVDPGLPGAIFNYATWESAVHGLAHVKELSDVRRKLFPTRLPDLKPKLKPKPAIHKNASDGNWAIPFIGSDRSVIQRTQRHMYEYKNKRPVQIRIYQEVRTFPGLILLLLYGGLFQVLAKYKMGRSILLKYPELFSAGIVSREGPLERKMEKLKFILTFHGQGWDENGSEMKNAHPNKNIVGQVEGYNPGYRTAATAATLAAIIIITETDQLPNRGGVYSPGAAFADTSLLGQLQENGIRYSIKSKL